MEKEKIAIVSSMAAVATFLVGIALLAQLCIAGTHEHIYDLDFSIVDGEFVLSGKCQSEDCEDPEYFERSMSDVVTSVIAASCSNEGSTVHKIERFGKVYEYKEHSGRGEHTVDGKPISTVANADGSLNYDIKGVKLYPAETYVCGGITEGYFNCDSCKADIAVKVFKPHVGEYVTTLEPTCDTDGVMKSVCTVCHEELPDEQKIASYGHIFSYSVEELDDGKYDVTRVCTREGCESEKTVFESVALTLDRHIDATCFSPEENTYVATLDGVETEFKVYGKTSHDHGEIEITEGDTVEYDPERVILFGEADFTNGPVEGYIVCDNCGEYIRVWVVE